MEELCDIELTYKEYLYRLRKAEMGEPYIIVGENCSSTLKRYIQYVIEICDKYIGDDKKFYSNIKQACYGFMSYFTISMSNIAQICENYCIKLNKADLLELMKEAIDKHTENQRYFLDEFVPITPREHRMYDEVVTLHESNMSQLSKMSNYVASCKRQEVVDEFVRHHFKNVVLQCSYTLFYETHAFISMMIAERISIIRSCLENISNRIDTNLKEYKRSDKSKLVHLRNELYDMNKEQMMLTRRDRVDPAAYSAVNKTILETRNAILNSGATYSLRCLEIESAFWHRRLKALNEIIGIMVDLEQELQKIVADEKKLEALKSTTEDWSKLICPRVLDFDYEERKRVLKKKIVETSRCYLTFCCVKGWNNINYKDKVGSYIVDEFNHRAYIQDLHSIYLHTNCQGDFIRYSETIPYYYDEAGRYIIKDGKKVYQIAVCTSEYELNSNNLLKKITKDCGHSEEWHPECLMGFTDETDYEILPSIKPVNIKGTLPAESVKYLWDTFGWILPEVLCKLGEAKPKNPIHILAHELLRKRERTSQNQTQMEINEAALYRSSMHNEKMKKAQDAKAWRRKNLPHQGPEDDDSQRVANDYKELLKQTHKIAEL